MIGGTFINRESELSLFRLEFAATTSARNRLIFLAAPSGFGKSEFTERLISEQHSAVGLKVRIPANAGGDAPFIRALAEELHRVARRDSAVIAGDAFLRGVLSSRLRKEHDMALVSSIAVPTPQGITSAIRTIVERVTNTAGYDFERLLQDASRDATVTVLEYVRYAFSQHRFCVAVENIQAIDGGSESMLEQVFENQRGHFVVLEYTLDAAAARDLAALQRVFAQRGSDVKVFVLEQLPLIEIIQRSEYRLDASIQTELFANFDGNLRKVHDLIFIRMKSLDFVGAASAADVGFAEATSQLVAARSPAAQFVLALIVTHRSNATHEALLTLSLQSRYFRDTHVGMEQALDELTENHLILMERSRIRLAHDSIAAEVTRGFSKYVELANRAWAVYYRRRLDQEDFGESSKDQVLDFLFGFYVRTDPTKLQPLLGEVRRIALSSLSVQRAETILQSIEDSLLEQRSPEAYEQTLRWELLDTYYSAGLYGRALGTLLQIRTRPMRRTVFHAAILDRLDRHEEAIDLIERTLQTRAPAHDAFELSLKLIEMICHRSLNHYKAVGAIHRHIASTPDYSRLAEYGYFLRNSEIVLPIDDSVPLLNQSVEIFNEAGKTTAEAQSRISLGMQLVRLGRLDEAEAQFSQATALLHERRIEWHVIHNNRAVLKLYRPEHDHDEIDELLVAAYLTASIPFDRLAIQNNRLIVHALGGDFSFCEALTRELAEKAPEQADEVLLCITYYNISAYYQMSGDEAASKRFRAKARACGNDWPQYWAFRFDGTPITADPAAEYLARFPFDPVLLSSWHIEVSDFGERSE